jgi:hypothetical protein
MAENRFPPTSPGYRSDTGRGSEVGQGEDNERRCKRILPLALCMAWQIKL